MHSDDHNLLLLDLPFESATMALGERLGAVLTPGLVVYLEGDLGAGKTTMVRGLLRGLGYAGRVKSPTYTLVEVHVVSGLNFYHLDFYRLERPEEYLDAGLDECFKGDGICLVEWPGKAAPYLPPADVVVMLSVAGEGRAARVEAHSDRGRACVTSLSSAAASRDEKSSSSPPRA